jgi:DNA-binding transcriptional LysR family regulator
MTTFVRIVAAGGLSAAARQLNTTQPTVSRQLRNLESYLHVRLLNRSTHAMSLTDAGRRYYEYARGLLEGLEAFEGDLRGEIAAPSGVLRVIVPTAFGQDWLVDIAARFLQECPNVTLEWRLSESSVRFDEQAVDCVIRVGEPKEEAAIARRIGEVQRLVVSSRSFIDKFGEPTQPEDLAGMPWLTLDPYFRDKVDLRNEQGNLKRIIITPHFITDHILATRAAARLGSGVTLISEWAVRDDLARGELVRLLPRWRGEPVPIHLIYPRAHFYPAKLRRFIEIVETIVPMRLSEQLI